MDHFQTMEPRGLSFAVQHAYTFCAAAVFADAMAAHPSVGRGAAPMDIWCSARRRDGAEVGVLHTVLLMPGGDLLDADGIRDFDTVCRDFGADPASCVLLIRDTCGSAAPLVEAEMLRRIADVSGWSGGLPDTGRVRGEPGWADARRRFCRGEAPPPVPGEDLLTGVLASCITRPERGAAA